MPGKYWSFSAAMTVKNKGPLQASPERGGLQQPKAEQEPAKKTQIISSP